MYTIDQRSHDNTVWFRATGKISVEESKAILAEVERRIDDHGKVNVLFEMEDIGGISPSAMWEDAKFDWKHRDDYERLAIVGDKRWQEAMTKISKPFFDELKWFPEEEREDAWRWVEGGGEF